MVQHLDSRALSTVSALYRRLVPENADVLDLMASYDSHLHDCRLQSLQVLGMNAEELRANRLATAWTVQDLNQEPALPFDDACLDAVACTASIEYLVEPWKILAEIVRALRPGGVSITTFSNRWFPTKAVRVWSELHEYERVGMVTQWMRQAGFTGLHTFSSRGWPRPGSDPYSAEIAMSDPVFGVWGFRPAT
jgi:SAM-dependent methyltransferase